jgi:hypothetical protein
VREDANVRRLVRAVSLRPSDPGPWWQSPLPTGRGLPLSDNRNFAWLRPVVAGTRLSHAGPQSGAYGTTVMQTALEGRDRQCSEVVAATDNGRRWTKQLASEC